MGSKNSKIMKKHRRNGMLYKNERFDGQTTYAIMLYTTKEGITCELLLPFATSLLKPRKIRVYGTLIKKPMFLTGNSCLCISNIHVKVCGEYNKAMTNGFKKMYKDEMFYQL